MATEAQTAPRGTTLRRRRTVAEWCARYIRWQAVALLAVIAVTLFFNEHSVVQHYRYDAEKAELKAAIRAERDSLALYNDLNRRLDTDRGTMERIGREHYHMQRPEEDVYLINR